MNVWVGCMYHVTTTCVYVWEWQLVGCHHYDIGLSMLRCKRPIEYKWHPPKFVMWYIEFRFHLNYIVWWCERWFIIRCAPKGQRQQWRGGGSGTKQNPELHLNRYFRLEEHQLLKSFCFSSKILKISHGCSRILQVKATRILAIEGVWI